MRISGNANMDTLSLSKSQQTNTVMAEKVVKQGSEAVKSQETKIKESSSSSLTVENTDETKVKVQEAVNKMNEMLEVNNSTSKFMYHEGLERYYVTVVDRETEEVVKEIPPKRLLDAYYEMQKMLGMIVDEKI